MKILHQVDFKLQRKASNLVIYPFSLPSKITKTVGCETGWQGSRTSSQLAEITKQMGCHIMRQPQNKCQVNLVYNVDGPGKNVSVFDKQHAP